jgi:hypothetical protein
VPGAVGLVGGIAHPRRRKTPDVNPTARCERQGSGSSFDGIAALAVFAHSGNDGQTHLLSNGPGKEPAHRMRLPAAGFCSSLDVAPPGRFSNSRILAALLPSRAPVAFFPDLRAVGAFLAGVDFFPDLGFFVAAGATRAPGRGFFVTFGSAAALAGAVSVCSVMVVILAPCAVITAVTT